MQHEIMHALGFLHEHQRCDRQYYIDILYENVEDGFRSNFEPRCGTGSNEGFDFGVYDELSIMHYPTWAFSKNGLPTIQSLRGRNAIMGSRVVSVGDKDAVDHLYGAFNDAPTLVFSLPEGTQFEGTYVNFSAGNSFDPDDPSLEYIWNFGDGSCDGAPPKPFDCSQPNPRRTYAGSGKYAGRVAVTDGYSLARTSFVLVVENLPPTGSITAETRIPEGGSTFVTVFVGDPGRDDVTFELDPGTGAGVRTGLIALSRPEYDSPSYPRSRSFEIFFPESGVFSMSARLTDSQGATSVVQRLITVENRAPMVSIASLNPLYTSGVTIPFAMSISDPGVNDGPWTYTWEVGFRAPVLGALLTLGSHFVPLQACAPGVWPTTLTVQDKDGASVTASRSVTVAAFAVSVDVLPGGTPNTVSLSRQGRLSTAVLGSASFNVSGVDVATLELGDGVGNDTRVDRRKDGDRFSTIEDVNDDGYLDLLLLFDLGELRLNGDLAATTTSLSLRGKLRDGCTHVRGVDAVRMVR